MPTKKRPVRKVKARRKKEFIRGLADVPPFSFEAVPEERVTLAMGFGTPSAPFDLRITAVRAGVRLLRFEIEPPDNALLKCRVAARMGGDPRWMADVIPGRPATSAIPFTFSEMDEEPLPPLTASGKERRS